MFGLFSGGRTASTQPGGYIAGYELSDWWQEAFSAEERRRIEEVYEANPPLGLSVDKKKPLTEGLAARIGLSTAGFLWSLSSWFEGPNNRDIARKILRKADEVNSKRGSTEDILDEHFTISQAITIYYRDRKDRGYYDQAVRLCRRQIELAPRAKEAFLTKYPEQPLPSHAGYKQLVIILDKEKKWTEAVALCKQAQREGWSGDWDKRIARYEGKAV
jgi:tetratricopeptide (TPR) repeat protein